MNGKMGFIKGAIDAVGGTFADQWLDYFTPPTKFRSRSSYI